MSAVLTRTSTQPKQARQRKCKVCRCLFTPRSMTHKACSQPCAEEVARAKREQQERKAQREQARADRERLAGLRPLSYWRNKAQAGVNRFVRLRDAGKPCISCGATTATQWHAGHYLSRGARPELALEPRNIHKQCSQCNDYLSGNLVRYRANLIELKGFAEVEWLEGPHPARHYSADDFRAIEAEFKALANQLERKLNDK